MGTARQKDKRVRHVCTRKQEELPAGARGGRMEVRAGKTAPEVPCIKIMKGPVSHAKECGLYPADNTESADSAVT